MNQLEATLLRCVDGLWVLVKKEKPEQPVYLGSAGNPHKTDFCSFIREGMKVFVGRIGEEKIVQIPAEAILKGFHRDKDDKSLLQILEEGVRYNHLLRPAH